MGCTLHKYHWPGNIRELEHAIFRAHVENDLATTLTEHALITGHPPLITAEVQAYLESRGGAAFSELEERLHLPRAAIRGALLHLKDRGCLSEEDDGTWKPMLGPHHPPAADRVPLLPAPVVDTPRALTSGQGRAKLNTRQRLFENSDSLPLGTMFEKILAFVRIRGSVERHQVEEPLGCSRSSASRLLVLLVKAGALKPVRTKNDVKYLL